MKLDLCVVGEELSQLMSAVHTPLLLLHIRTTHSSATLCTGIPQEPRPERQKLPADRCAGSHGDADVSSPQGGRIVHAIARHGHHMPLRSASRGREDIINT